MARSGGPRRPVVAVAILGLAAWQAAFIGTPLARSGRGPWKTPAQGASKAVKAAAAGDARIIWVQLKDGLPVSHPREGLRTVRDLLKVVEQKLAVTTTDLKLYKSQRAFKNNREALSPSMKLEDIPGTITKANPLYIDCPASSRSRLTGSNAQGPDGEPPAKAAQFDSDWEDKILALGPYEDTLPDSEMPFVNRHSEVFQLFEANFRAVRRLSTSVVKNYRGLKVCFAAQIFGSGKTTLGENFVRQLSDPEFKNFTEDQLKGKEESYAKAFRAEWELAQKARTLYVDLRGRTAVSNVPGILAKQAGVALPADTDIAEGIGEVILATARQSSEPLFVHIDEIGGFGQDVRSLRDGVCRTWLKMNALRGEAMPHIYFYLSGKGIPLTVLGQSTSPVGTKWIILDVLRVSHIKRIRESLLPDGDDRLDEKLYQWTGGAPRLLLYVLRALHHLRTAGTLPDDPDRAMETISDILGKIDMVANDVFVDARVEKDLQEAWLHLLVLAQLRVPCGRKMVLRAGGSEFTMERLLGALNVYITKCSGDGDDDTFRVHIMKLVEQFVRKKFSSDCRVPLFFGDVGTPGLDSGELLERLVEQRIIVQACLVDAGLQWKDLLGPLLGGSRFGSARVVLDRNCPLVLMPGVTNSTKVIPVAAELSERDWLQQTTIHPANLCELLKTVRSGRIYRPRPKSGSADTFVKQQEFLIEIQDKSGAAAGLTMANMVTEVEKCVKDLDVVLVIVALELGKSWQRWVGADGALRLEPGTYQAEKGSRNGSLLYKPPHSAEWQCAITSGRREAVKGTPTGQGKQLIVREGLEVVVPSVAAVSRFLGEADFEIVKGLASKEKKAEVPFLSRFFGFDRPLPQAAAELGDDTVVITVMHGEVTKEVEFSRDSDAAEIKEAICLEVGIRVGTVFRLRNDKGRGVAINGSLKPGAYVVTVVPQEV